MAECPSQHDLEEHVSRGDNEAVRCHLDACTHCAALAGEIRLNNELLRELSSIGRPAPRLRPIAEKPIVEGYEILNSIGHGSQGVVFRAIQRATKRTVAIKVHNTSRFARMRQRKRFEREVELAAGLRHPNIVTIFDSGTCSDGRDYFVMEFFEGEPLDAYIARKSEGTVVLDVVERVRLFLKVCAAVQHAHLRGVIHRDLKPANILVDHAGEPRIVDFGLAKLADDSAAAHASQTQAGEFAGTLAYASPEQTRGEPGEIDTRTDVYSLGVILYELLTQQLPYDMSGSMSGALRQIMEAPPRSPTLFRPEIDRDLETILFKSLAKEPARRYQTVDQFAKDLDHFLADEPIDARGDSTWYVLRKIAKRHRLSATAALTLVCLLVGFAVAMSVAYRRTATAEATAQKHAGELDLQLSSSNLERGRALSAAGSFPQAERLIWTEYFKAAAAPGFEQEYAVSAWALRELYWRHPCIASFPIPKSGWIVLNHDASRVVRQIEGSTDIEVRDVPSGQRVRRFKSPVDHAGRGVVADAKHLVLVSGGDLYLLDLDTGQVLGKANGTDRPTCVSISTEAGLIASASRPDGTLQLWRIPDLAPAGTIQAHQGLLNCAVFSSDGSLLATAGRNDLTLRVWDVATRRLLSAPVTATREPFRAMAFTTDGRSLHAFNGDADDTTIRLDDSTSLPLDWLAERSSDVPKLRVSPTSSLVAHDGRQAIHLTDPASGEQLAQLGHNAERDRLFAFTDRGDRLVSASAVDSVVRIWDVQAATTRPVLAGHEQSVLSGFLSPDRLTLTTASSDQSIRRWDAQSGLLLSSITFSQIVQSVTYNERGGIAVALHDGSIQVRDPVSLEVSKTWHASKTHLYSIRFSPDGQRLATAGIDKIARVWDASTGELIQSFGDADEGLTRIGFSSDGRLVAAGGHSGALHIWNVETGLRVQTLRGHTATARNFLFLDNGKRMISCSDDQTIRIWNLANGECEAVLRGHSAGIWSLDLDGSERLLASVDSFGEVAIWDLKRRQKLAAFPISTRQLFGVDLTDDGKTLYCWGGEFLVFKLELEKLDLYRQGNRGTWEHRLLHPQ
jgi:serine/threonine protein kinase/WD40 repeat protein